jgi:thiamine-phosphate pyrophosphorylase
MLLHQTRPLIYLITSGETTAKTTPRCNEFSKILSLVEAAVASESSLIQLREKNLSARVLYDLAVQAAALTKGTTTRLLVNDRFDIALAAEADGVQLTSKSINADVVRATCGEDFLIGVSTHSLNEARKAQDQGADFVVFGPVFETKSKRAFGSPQGVEKLEGVTTELGVFPVIAIGGVAIDNTAECFRAGASGVAAIRLLGDANTLPETVEAIRESYRRAV